jgi:hypothetical protein
VGGAAKVGREERAFLTAEDAEDAEIRGGIIKQTREI